MDSRIHCGALWTLRLVKEDVPANRVFMPFTHEEYPLPTLQCGCDPEAKWTCRECQAKQAKHLLTLMDKTKAKARKQQPIASGVLDYFPDALLAIANVSFVGNEQHNPGSPLHWDRSKSTDESDALIRHFLERGTLDDDGLRHSAKLAWRALALLQKEIENMPATIEAK